MYPNTATPHDVGEYVVVTFPESTTLAGWTLTDTKTTAQLPNRTVEGRVAFTMNTTAAGGLTDDPVMELDGHLTLAQDGDTIRLQQDGVVVDETTYDRASRATRWVRTDGSGGPSDDGWEWRAEGATTFEARTLPAEGATAFALPDAPEVPIETLRSAEDRLLLAGYTFESEAVVEELRAADARGVEIAVLVDGTPVGGQTEAEADALDALSDAGISVRVFGGDRKRYRFHHAKYAVVDDRTIVLTENWKPSGTGGGSNRGWGVTVEGRDVADEVSAVFEADASWKDTRSWTAYRKNRTFFESERANGTYPATFRPERVPVESVRVVTAPDNAEEEIVALLDGAEESIRI